jgi:hypothetical protein
VQVEAVNRQFMRDNEKKFAALLVSLRRMVHVPDEADSHYREYLLGIMTTYAIVYRQLLRQQATYVIEGQLTRAIPYLSVAEQIGYRAGTVTAEPFVEAMFARTLPSGYTLSDRIWGLKTYSRDIYSVVENGLRNNLSPSTIARQLDGFVLPGRQLTAPTPYGRTVSFDSMRLARTEVLDAEREAVREMAKQCPWIVGLTWELSANHSRECECDDYAIGGPYTEYDAPEAPHPQCQCSLVPIEISPKEWQGSLEAYEGGLDILGIGKWVAGGLLLYELSDEGETEG